MRTTYAQVRRTAGILVTLTGAVALVIAFAEPAARAAPQAARASKVAMASEPAGAVVASDGMVVPMPSLERKVEILGLDAPHERIGSASMPVLDRAGGGRCPDAPPLSEADARALVLKVAQEEDFYPEFVLSVATVESNFRSNALSDKGAYGLMQLMPATGETFKVDICQPRENVLGGVRFLRSLHQKYKNPFFILAAYNAGEVAVQQAKGVPPITETVRFVASVMNEFYDWPRVEPSRGAPRRAGASPRRSAPAESRGREDESRWASGFVMHLDQGGQQNAQP